ncbi:hypothetical protein B0T10DRAFT_457458 [Thelonectria olida]|uniref:Uncharacterized protein n=1 Tax=Thelonectria olida TaxID=1576542 RepID=A0A9P9API1_9HYPO|nr:hypothetical protein B0T10DRAFT_457458 [Thelonectria olida]
MVTSTSWAIIARDGGDHSSNPESDGSSTSSSDGSIMGTDTLAQDLFQDKFMTIARGGSNGEKIMRGFLIGVAVGLIVACFVCCWYPCCRSDRPRRQRGPRRPPVEMEEETANRPEQPAESAPTTTPSPNTVPPA